VAVATARENVAANGLSPWIRTGQAVGFRSGLIRGFAPYDLVCANILAAPLKRLAPDIARHLGPGGRAVLSGLLTTQAPGVSAVYAGQGLAVEERIVIGEWTTLLVRRA